MTRNEVAAEFELSPEGIIKAPENLKLSLYTRRPFGSLVSMVVAKNCFSPPPTPPFWPRPVEPADREEWPDIPASTAVIALWGSPNGFVLSKALDKVEADRWRADAARAGKPEVAP